MSFHHKTVQKEGVAQIFQHYTESLLKHHLPMEVVQMLYTEDVISKEIFNELESSEGLLSDASLKALSSTMTKDSDQLRIFGAVLSQSKETVGIGQDILKNFGK